MIKKLSYGIPLRVWINCPSTGQPYHNYHGRVGIAQTDKKTGITTIYFCEGSTHSMVIDPIYLSEAV